MYEKVNGFTEVTTSEKPVIAIINGPNINMLGIREPVYYGEETMNTINSQLTNLAKAIEVDVIFYQSNHEGKIVDYIQENIQKVDGIIINPAAFTKTGYSILDALIAVDIPFIEVHLSNIFAREAWHAESIYSARAIGVIHGFQGFSYQLALRGIVNYIIQSR